MLPVKVVLYAVKIMKFNKTILVFLLFLGLSANAQEKDTISILEKPLSQYPAELIKKDEFGNRYYYDEAQKARIYEIDGEKVIVLDELVLVSKPKFNNQLDRNYYFFLNKKLNRVYPLFVTALEQYRDLNAQMESMDEDDRRKFSRDKQNQLADQYEAQLRDLTTSEGQIFAKLMYRATGKSVFDIIKELRGGWSAFWWNVKGNIADVNIKEPYDPHQYRHDEFVESLLQTNWNLGYLKPYPGANDFKIKR